MNDKLKSPFKKMKINKPDVILFSDIDTPLEGQR